MSIPHATQIMSVPRRAVLAGMAATVAAGALMPALARVPGYESLGEVRAGLASDTPVVETVGGGTIEIVFADGAAGLDRDRARAWIRASAEAVSAYFGHFPVEKVAILVVAQDGARVGHATTWGYRGSTIRVGVGRDTDAAAYASDWVMVHEMMHLALPNLPENQLWALEGSATYAEPIARVQLGRLKPAKIWGDMMRDMPQGLPRAGDGGLDHSGTWGRNYWGGAVFYLVADVRIRQASGNRTGLQDAFRAINRESGGNEAEWTMDRVATVGDKATGTDVLTTLYAEMRDVPAPVDLDALFRDLGVADVGGAVRLNDAAPLAAIRRAITAPRQA